MATTTKHAPGTFCWPELGTTDQPGAKRFYASLFGWTINDFPMGPDAGVYTIFKNQGQDCAALYTLMPDMLRQGIPPHWNAYVSVVDTDAAALRATALGGKVLMPPIDVMGSLGRMAVIQDPTGAVFSVWQAKDHGGAAILDEEGALCWTELMTPDTAKAEAFYQALLGWKSETMPMEGGAYTVFKRPDDAYAGGMMKTQEPMKNVPPHWTSYFQVADAKAIAEKTQQLGGGIIAPPMTVPNVGEIAVLRDPQGAVFAILQPAR